MMAARALQLAGLALALAGARAADCHIDSPMAAPANGNYGGLCATKLDFGVGEGCTLSCGAGFAVSGDGPVCVAVNTWENLGTQRCVAAAPAPPEAQATTSGPEDAGVLREANAAADTSACHSEDMEYDIYNDIYMYTSGTCPLDSWIAGTEPCGDGYNSWDRGWIGVVCDARGGRVVYVGLSWTGVGGE
eukprot:COSAG04_NODE_8603_length_952_cov_1.852286_1_plen_189_part_01